MPRLLIPIESAAAETRVAASPETLKKFIALGCSVAVERGAGVSSGFLDETYASAGADLVAPGEAQAWGQADILLCVQSPSPASLSRLRRGALVVGHVVPLWQSRAIGSVEGVWSFSHGP